MAERVASVGGDVYFYHPVTFQPVIFGGGLPHGSVIGQYDNAGVVGANANLVLGAYHAQAFYAAQFAFLDGETLVSVIEHATEIGHDDFLASGHVGRAAYYLLWLTLAKVHHGNMQMVAIGMRFASEHLAHVEAFQSSLDGLHFLQCVNLQSARGQRVRGLLRREVKVYVFLKPFI